MSSKLDEHGAAGVGGAAWLTFPKYPELLFSPPANVTRCQNVSVLSHNCAGFNHSAGQIGSLELVWGVKRSGCCSICILQDRSCSCMIKTSSLLLFSSTVLILMMQVKLINSPAWFYTPPKMTRWDKYLFSCSIVSSAGHIWAGRQYQQKPQQRSAASSSSIWSPAEPQLLRRNKKKNQ